MEAEQKCPLINLCLWMNKCRIIFDIINSFNPNELFFLEKLWLPWNVQRPHVQGFQFLALTNKNLILCYQLIKKKLPQELDRGWGLEPFEFEFHYLG